MAALSARKRLTRRQPRPSGPMALAWIGSVIFYHLKGYDRIATADVVLEPPGEVIIEPQGAVYEEPVADGG